MDIDSIALVAARKIAAIDPSSLLGGTAQYKAKIQCIVIDALNSAPVADVRPDPASAAIKYALENPGEDPIAFLRCWMHGNFDAIRREWPDAPEEVFIGADPLHPKTKL